jgi:hypothetical protein
VVKIPNLTTKFHIHITAKSHRANASKGSNRNQSQKYQTKVGTCRENIETLIRNEENIGWLIFSK